MFLGDVQRALAVDGLSVSATHVRYLILAGHLDPAPKNSLGAREYGPQHVDQLREYLRRPTRRGRRPRREEEPAVA